MTRRALILLTLICGLSPFVVAQRLAIGQIDTGRLLFGQRVDVYVSLDLPDGARFDRDSLRIYESADGEEYREVDAIYDIDQVRNLNAPLSFYMLVDNSGSMYDEHVPGHPDLRRIDAARQAIRDFVNRITHDQDQIGLALFATRYEQLASPSRDKTKIGPMLEAIERPGSGEGFTELYAALVEAASDARAMGRRTVVVLSDGENFPFSVHRGDPHPEYGTRVFEHTEAIDAFQREGMSLFAIHYGDDEEDPNLGVIAEETGGRVYRAIAPEDLAQVYQDIRLSLLEEYRITYQATMSPADQRFVRVTYQGAGIDLTTDRPYFASTLFAGRDEAGTVFLIGSLVLGLLGLAALLTLAIRAGSSESSLVLLDAGSAKALAKTVALGPNDTVIGASPEADVTIAGSPSVSEQHAVVSYEPKRAEFTIISETPIRVNNKPVTQRILKPGDVINIEGTVFAFDEPIGEEDRRDEPAGDEDRRDERRRNEPRRGKPGRDAAGSDKPRRTETRRDSPGSKRPRRNEPGGDKSGRGDPGRDSPKGDG